MALSINNNLMALTAANNLTRSYGNLSKSINKLSSGMRINGAADDAAGLAVRELMRSDIAVLNQGVRNANDAISMLQTMDGAAAVIDEKLIRMKELAEQAATGTYSTAQRSIMNDEFVAMRAEIERIAQATDFNGIKMLNASGTGAASVAQVLEFTEDANNFGATASAVTAFTTFATGETLVLNYTNVAGTASSCSMTLTNNTTITSVMNVINDATVMGGFASASWTMHQGLVVTDGTAQDTAVSLNFRGGGSYDASATTAGADATSGTIQIHFGTGNNSAEDYYSVNNQNMTTTGLSIDTLSISTQASAAAALATIDAAILSKDTGRAHFGAIMNRLENTVSNLTIQAENIQAAEAQISDVDVAYEMTNFMNTQIKAQAAVAMLSQANSMPQMAMTLLQG